MKIILIVLLISLSLFAKKEKTCYTVQLLSTKNSGKNLKNLLKRDFPKSCKVMELKRSIAVRCGCFSNMDSAEDELYKLEDKYVDASITTTYSKRFKKKRKRVSQKKSDSKKTCYSVQVFKKLDNKTTRDILSDKIFPNNCKAMSIGKSIAVRCGCYKTHKEAKVEKYILADDYKDVAITTTYTYKFEDKLKKIQALKSVPKEKKRKREKSKATCYSVEIFRAKNTQMNMGKLLTNDFPSNCTTMDIKNMISVRCGCYDSKKGVVNRYKKLKKRYKNARVSKSYKHRFEK